MPERNRERYSKENLEKIRKLRGEGFSYKDIDAYFNWPRGSSSYFIRKMKKYEQRAQNIPTYVPEKIGTAHSGQNSKPVYTITPTRLVTENKLTEMGNTQHVNSLKLVVDNIAEVLKTRTNRSNATAQVENIRGILMGHNLITRR